MALLRIRVDQVKSQDPMQNSLAQQLSGMNQPYYSFQKAKEGDTVFQVETPYQQGNGSLLVFLNGLKLQPTTNPLVSMDGDYHEVSPTSIQFIDPLFDDDIVEVRLPGVGQGISMVVDHYHTYMEEPTGPVDGVNKVFIIGKAPKAGTQLVFINGLLKRPGDNHDYLISGNVLTFNYAPALKSVILVNFDNQYSSV